MLENLRTPRKFWDIAMQGKAMQSAQKGNRDCSGQPPVIDLSNLVLVVLI